MTLTIISLLVVTLGTIWAGSRVLCVIARTMPDPAAKKGFKHPAAPDATYGHTQKFRGHDETKAVAAAKRAAAQEAARRKLAAQASRPQPRRAARVEPIRREAR